MFYPIFLYGSFWFWVLCVVTTIALIAFIEEERPGSAFVIIAVYFLLGYFFGDINVASYIIDNPIRSLMYVGMYVGIGFAWSFVRLAVWARKDKIRQLERYEKTVEIAKRENRDSSYVFVRPSFGDVKSRVIVWVSYWPWSMFWTVCRNFILELIEIIVDNFGGLYAKVLSKCWGSLPEDYESPASRK